MHGKSSVDSQRARDAAGLDEKARKNGGTVVRAMQVTTLAALAKFTGLSDSSLSRWLSEKVWEPGKVLAFLGLKVVPAHYECLSPQTYAAYQHLAEEYVIAKRTRRVREAAFEQALMEEPE